jgi:pimeloyl-ACP methyl ester carboxylesterase
MPVVQTDDKAKLYYWTLGSGPTPLILLHGWGGAGSGHSWRQVLPHLRLDGARLIIVDQRGHGGSSSGSAPFSTDRLVQDVIAVADDAGATRFVSVAFSMSGKWAQALAVKNPSRLWGQVLVAPVPLAAFPMSEEMTREWIRITRDRALFGEFINGFTKQKLSSETMDDYFHDASTTPESTLSETLRVCSGEDLSSLKCEEPLKTLVCAGAHDPMFTPESLQKAIGATFSECSGVVLDGGHELPIEAPKELAALIENFISTLPVEELNCS